MAKSPRRRPRDTSSRYDPTVAGVKDRSRRQELCFAPNATVEWMLQGQQQDYNFCGQVRCARPIAKPFPR